MRLQCRIRERRSVDANKWNDTLTNYVPRKAPWATYERVEGHTQDACHWSNLWCLSTNYVTIAIFSRISLLLYFRLVLLRVWLLFGRMVVLYHNFVI